MRKLAALTLTGLFGLFGCGEDTDTLTPEQATQALAATEAALETVDGEVILASSGPVSGTVSCAGGGSTSVEGQYDGEDSFAVTVSFDGCAASDTTVDGDLEYAGSIADTVVSLRMDGVLRYSGAVEGRCLIALDVRATGAFAVEISGEICGQDAADLAIPQF